jgi:putative pre-16S rRNA nuclease
MLNAPGWVKHWSPCRGSALPKAPRTAWKPRAVVARRKAMRAAAIDLGKVRVGLAVADELGVMAHPRPYLDGRNVRRLLEALQAVAAEEDIGLFLVGLPRELKGAEGPPARRARKFAAELAARTGRRVELVDEWLSTREARGRLREQGLDERQLRGRVDSAAAAVLLQSWLDGQARQGG